MSTGIGASPEGQGWSPRGGLEKRSKRQACSTFQDTKMAWADFVWREEAWEEKELREGCMKECGGEGGSVVGKLKRQAGHPRLR